MLRPILAAALLVSIGLAAGCGDDKGPQPQVELPGFTCTYRRTDYMGDNGCSGEPMFRYDIDISWWTVHSPDISVVLFEIPVRESAWNSHGTSVVCISNEVGYSSETSELRSGEYQTAGSVGYNVYEYESGSFRSKEFLPEYNQQTQPVRAHVFWTDGTDTLYETDPVPR